MELTPSYGIENVAVLSNHHQSFDKSEPALVSSVESAVRHVISPPLRERAVMEEREG